MPKSVRSPWRTAASAKICFEATPEAYHRSNSVLIETNEDAGAFLANGRSAPKAVFDPGVHVHPLMPKCGAEASAWSNPRAGQSSRNVCQPDHSIANSITGYQAKRRPWSGKKRLAATQHYGVKVEPIFIDEAEVG